MSEITIRTLHTTKDLTAAVELQKVYWGEDAADLVPHHMLLSIVRYGGHVYGAFDGDKLVGLLIGFLGAIYDSDTDNASQRLMIMSKRMVVLPGYRGRKIGENLKYAQRDFARQHQIQLVSWTFDPLLARNAYLNFHKLGAIGQRYMPDYFEADANNPMLMADRILANWWVNHPHLERTEYPNAMNTPVVNATSLSDDGLLIPHEFRLPNHHVVRLEIPIEFVPLERIDPALGKQWRDYVRFAFQKLLEEGYIVIDFMRVENRVFYVFARNNNTFEFK